MSYQTQLWCSCMATTGRQTCESVQNRPWGSSSRCLQDHILTDTDTEPQSENNASYTIIGGNDSNTNRLGEGDTENLQHLVFYLFLFIYFFVYLCFAAIDICGYQYM